MPEVVAKRGPGRPPLGGPGSGESGFVMIRMAKDQKQKMERAAAAADLPASELLRRALQEKIARDAKIGKPPTMFTDKRTAVRLLLEECARFHAAGAPETAPALLAGYLERYKRDADFAREIDDGARQSLEQAERLKRRTLPLDSSGAEH